MGDENKFRQTGKRQLGHERLRETKLDNASGKGGWGEKAKNGARNVGGSRMRTTEGADTQSGGVDGERGCEVRKGECCGGPHGAEREAGKERCGVYIYIELDGREGGGRVAGPVGTERDGERKREQGVRAAGGTGGKRTGDAVGAGGCRRTARVESAKERGRASQEEEGGFGATVMSVCTRTPSRLRRWRNVATQPHRETRAASRDVHRGSGSSPTQRQDNALGIRGWCAARK